MDIFKKILKQRGNPKWKVINSWKLNFEVKNFFFHTYGNKKKINFIDNFNRHDDKSILIRFRKIFDYIKILK